MQSPNIFFEEAFRVLAPGGVLVVTTPNPEGLAAKLLGENWQGIDPGEHISFKFPQSGII